MAKMFKQENDEIATAINIKVRFFSCAEYQNYLLYATS